MFVTFCIKQILFLKLIFVIFEECKAKRTSQWQKNCKTEEIYGVAPVVNYQDPRVDKRKPLSPKRQLKPNPRQKGWRGITGEVPTEDQFREMLTESDLFIYCGHSTGERYLNAVHLQNLQRCAVTLLMGCSSGKLAPSGAFEPMGVVLNYLLCG
ncbi:separin protein, partial [Balamuthia mandrillaris]